MDDTYGDTRQYLFNIDNSLDSIDKSLQKIAEALHQQNELANKYYGMEARQEDWVGTSYFISGNTPK